MTFVFILENNIHLCNQIKEQMTGFNNISLLGLILGILIWMRD
jgi:hypothetical protein